MLIPRSLAHNLKTDRSITVQFLPILSFFDSEDEQYTV